MGTGAILVTDAIDLCINECLNILPTAGYLSYLKECRECELIYPVDWAGSSQCLDDPVHDRRIIAMI